MLYKVMIVENLEIVFRSFKRIACLISEKTYNNQNMNKPSWIDWYLNTFCTFSKNEMTRIFWDFQQFYECNNFWIRSLIRNRYDCNFDFI